MDCNTEAELREKFITEINSLLSKIFADNDNCKDKIILFTEPIYTYRIIAIDCNDRKAVCFGGRKLLEELPTGALEFVWDSLDCGKFNIKNFKADFIKHSNDCNSIQWFNRYNIKSLGNFNIHSIVNPLICTKELMDCIIFYGWNEFGTDIKHSNIEIDTDSVKVYVTGLSYSEYLTSMLYNLGKKLNEINPNVFSGSFGHINSNRKEPPYFIFYFTEKYTFYLNKLRNDYKKLFPMRVQLTEDDIMVEKIN